MVNNSEPRSRRMIPKVLPDTLRLPYWLRRLGYYGLAILFVVMAALLRWTMPDVLGPTPFLAFYLAWVGAAAFGGLGPGLLATAASWVCIDLLFDPANNLINFANPTTIGRLLILVAGGLTVSLIAERMRRGRIRERRQAWELARVKQEWERTFDTIPDLIAIVDPHHRILRTNRAMAERLAAAPEEYTGLPHHACMYGLDMPASTCPHEQTLADGREHTREINEPRLGGHLLVTCTPLRDPDGQIIGTVHVARDINERKQAEERLRESEAQLRTVVDNLTEGVVVATLDGQLLHWNRAALDMHGFASLEECQRRLPEFASVFELSTADGQTLPLERWPLARVLAGEDLRDWEVHVRRLDRDWKRIFNYGGSLVRDEQGQQLLAVVTISDITQRKAAEEELAQSERHYRLLFETMPQGVVYQDQDGKIVSMNPAAEQILGKTPPEFLGRTSMDEENHTLREDGSTFPGMEHPSMVALRTGREVRDAVMGVYDPRRREYRWIEISAVPLFRPGEDKPYQVYTHFADITARRQAEESMRSINNRLQEQAEELQAQAEELTTANEELRENEQILREREEQLRQRVEEVETLMDVAPVAIWVSHDPKCNHIIGNRAANSFYEAYERENVSANTTPVRRFFRAGRELKPEELPMQEAALENIDIRNTELDVLLPSGKWLNMLGSASPLLDTLGQVRGCVGAFVDITDRRHAEQALRESEERYYHLFEDDLTGDFITTTEGRIILCNPAFARIFGFPGVENALGTSMLDLYLNPDERNSLLDALRQRGRIDRFEVWRKRRDGTPIYVVENLVGVFDDRGELTEIKGYIFDDTDRKRAEDALRELNATLETKVVQRTGELEHRARQLQKLTLELSQAEDQERRRLAEILHDDLQQILAAAKFHLSLLSSRLKREPPQHAIATQIDHMLKDAIEKSRSLSHELSPAVLHHGDLTETLAWLAHQVQAKHGLVVHVDAFGQVASESDALRTFLYRAAQELLFNVVKHARVNEARIRVRRLGRYIGLSVSDRGRGLDPGQLSETAGFGLLSIRERVELLGGRMTIRSVIGQGSTFSIVVPDDERRVTERQEPQAAKNLASIPLTTNDQGKSLLRVLLADDHEIVREGLISLLNDEETVRVVGEAANGREAVDLAGRLKPDVVIMDVSMPLINGDEATRQIKQHLPGTRVIALSMFDEPETMERMLAAGAEAYVLKTAPSEELLAAIHGRQANTAA